MKVNYEVQFSINLILKDEIEQKNRIKNDLSQLGLTRQTHDLSYKMEITS
jgi:hypothetical protein